MAYFKIKTVFLILIPFMWTIGFAVSARAENPFTLTIEDPYCASDSCLDAESSQTLSDGFYAALPQRGPSPTNELFQTCERLLQTRIRNLYGITGNCVVIPDEETAMGWTHFEGSNTQRIHIEVDPILSSEYATVESTIRHEVCHAIQFRMTGQTDHDEWHSWCMESD